MDNNQTITAEDAVELGTWIGRKQAFSVVAGRCSAADAKCLREIREAKKYRQLGLTWEQFCRQYAGMGRAMADRTIQQLEEFGESFFHLVGLTRITPEDYRLIAGSVSEQGVEHGGETIPIDPANTARLNTAVDELRRQAKGPKAAPPESILVDPI
jgi:hypothetical protein